MHTLKQIKQQYPQCTIHTQVAIMKYGKQACVECFAQHEQGNGAKTIGAERGLTTKQADCAINAGRELAGLGVRADDTPPKKAPADDDIIGQRPSATAPRRAVAQPVATTPATSAPRAPRVALRPDTHPGTWSPERIAQARQLVRSALEIVNRPKAKE